jgi:hypothetical protein
MKIESLHLVVDLNHDGAYSMWELWESVKFVYRLPGNLIVEGLGHIPYASSLGIKASEATGYGSLNGLLAVTLSLLFWIIVLFSILTLSSPSTDELEENGEKDSGIREESLAGRASADSVGVSTARSRTGNDAWVSSAVRGHLPVSRPAYSARGSIKHKKPRRRHHLISYLIRHAK